MIHSDNVPDYYKVEITDNFIISYPRSGQTWLRSLLAHVKFANKSWMSIHVDTMIPDFRRTTREQRQHMPRPRLFKSHEFYNERYKNVLYLIRDPRAVAYSSWNWRSRMRKGHQWRYEGTFDIDFIKKFIKGEIFPGSWNEHVRGWIDNVQKTHTPKGYIEELMILKYEDLFNDETMTLQKVCDWLDIKCDRTKIDNALEIFPPGKLTHFLKSSIKPLGANPDEWKLHTTLEMTDAIGRAYDDIMTEFDYDY